MSFFKKIKEKIKDFGQKKIKISEISISSITKNQKETWELYKFLNSREQTLMGTLHPYVQKLVKATLYEARKEGLPINLFEAERTWERQGVLYSKGRDKEGKIVNKKEVVTYAKPGDSYHNYSLAVDLVFDGDTEKPGIQWSWDAINKPETLVDEAAERAKMWKRLGEIGIKNGLEWAGTWKKFPEMPHFQFTAGLGIKDLKMLYLKGRKAAVWYEIDRRLRLGAGSK